MDEAERRLCAAGNPDDWPCHTEAGYTWTDIQCRGHFDVRKKYTPTAAGVAALEEWRKTVLKQLGGEPSAID